MEQRYEITQEELNRAKGIISSLWNNYTSKVVGQPFLGSALMIAMMTNGHILLESVPGLAKTTAAKVMTEAVNGMFSRIQCTPDLIPSDIIGTQTYHAATNTFENKIGPVYANFLLLDEINRSSAKTQSAMLEAMQEKSVTIGGEQFKLPKVFVVIATQNPIENEGTYVLSEAQMDRFLLKVKLNYPSMEDELEILNRVEKGILEQNTPVATIEDIEFLQDLCKRVFVDESIKQYIVNIVQATRHTDAIIDASLSQYVEMGSSTRAGIAFMDAAKATALLNGRSFVIPDDVKSMRYSVLRHRIMLNYAAIADNIEEETIIDAIIGAVKTP